MSSTTKSKKRDKKSKKTRKTKKTNEDDPVPSLVDLPSVDSSTSLSSKSSRKSTASRKGKKKRPSMVGSTPSLRPKGKSGSSGSLSSSLSTKEDATHTPKSSLGSKTSTTLQPIDEDIHHDEQEDLLREEIGALGMRRKELQESANFTKLLSELGKLKKADQATLAKIHLGLDDTALRFLESTGGNVKKAKTKIVAFLKWWNTTRPDLITKDILLAQSSNPWSSGMGWEESGACVLGGVDKRGRQSLIVFPALHRTIQRADVDGNVNALLYYIEQCVNRVRENNLQAKEPIKELCAIIDYSGAVLKRNFDKNFLPTATKLLLNYYPGWFGNLLILAPTVVWRVTWKSIERLLPVNSEWDDSDKRLLCVPGNRYDRVLMNYFTRDELPIEYGGKSALLSKRQIEILERTERVIESSNTAEIPLSSFNTNTLTKEDLDKIRSGDRPKKKKKKKNSSASAGGTSSPSDTGTGTFSSIDKITSMSGDSKSDSNEPGNHKKDKLNTKRRKEIRDLVFGGNKQADDKPDRQRYTWEVDFTDISKEDQIGQGGMGNVHLGMWRGTKVAIKTMKTTGTIEEDDLTTFLREIDLMAQLRHPNITLLLGACLDYPHIAIIMEYAENGNLHTYLIKNNISLKAKMQCAMDAARGMLFLHLRTPPVLHQDLKSYNLLVSSAGRVKVADFGISQTLESNMGVVDTDNEAIGSLNWLAPEVLDSRPRTTKTDVWAFGMVLYEIISEEVPFYGAREVAILNRIMEGDIPDMPENTPHRLTDVYLRCCLMRASDRPEFDEILEQLELVYKELPDEEAAPVVEKHTNVDDNHGVSARKEHKKAVHSPSALLPVDALKVSSSSEQDDERDGLMEAAKEFLVLSEKSLARVPLCVVDRRGVIVRWTLGAENLLGYGSADVVGCMITVIMSPKLRNRCPRAIASACEEEQFSSDTELSFATALHENGEEVPIAMTLHFLHSDGHPYVLAVLSKARLFA